MLKKTFLLLLLTFLFKRGNIRIISVPLKSTLISAPILSKTSTVSFLVNSQKRNLKALDLEVNAPTGHKSTILPDNSLFKFLDKN